MLLNRVLTRLFIFLLGLSTYSMVQAGITPSRRAWYKEQFDHPLYNDSDSSDDETPQSNPAEEEDPLRNLTLLLHRDYQPLLDSLLRARDILTFEFNPGPPPLNPFSKNVYYPVYFSAIYKSTGNLYAFALRQPPKRIRKKSAGPLQLGRALHISELNRERPQVHFNFHADLQTERHFIKQEDKKVNLFVQVGTVPFHSFASLENPHRIAVHTGVYISDYREKLTQSRIRHLSASLEINAERYVDGIEYGASKEYFTDFRLGFLTFNSSPEIVIADIFKNYFFTAAYNLFPQSEKEETKKNRVLAEFTKKLNELYRFADEIKSHPKMTQGKSYTMSAGYRTSLNDLTRVFDPQIKLFKATPEELVKNMTDFADEPFDEQQQMNPKTGCTPAPIGFSLKSYSPDELRVSMEQRESLD